MKLRRKVKIFVMVGVAGLFVATGLLVWAGISAFNYVASSTQKVMQSPAAEVYAQNLKSEIKELPKFKALSCWFAVENLLGFEPWLARPAQQNFSNLRSACFQPKAELINTAEGEII
jgi:hypothetical protein